MTTSYDADVRMPMSVSFRLFKKYSFGLLNKQGSAVVSWSNVGAISMSKASIDKCSLVECFGEWESEFSVGVSSVGIPSGVDESGMSVMKFFKMILCAREALGYHNRSADEDGSFVHDRSMVDDLDGCCNKKN